MVDDFAPKNLRARLDAVRDRIAQARSQLESHGLIGDQTSALTELIVQHDAILETLDAEGTITEIQHGKATAQTDALESALSGWLKSVESSFNHPVPRTSNISM